MQTTCPLDCYDACSVLFENEKLKGDPHHPLTQGFLCPSLNSFLKTPRLTNPRYQGVEVSMDEALAILTSLLQQNQDKSTLFFKGSGNMGCMQNVTNLFFKNYGAIFTKGSLCDGAGEAGIVEGRGANLALSIAEVAKSEVVVVWGRNLTKTNAHLYNTIKDKILIVIDPVKTEIAQKADIHIQLCPKSDFYLAILFARIAYIEEMQDSTFIEEYTQEYDYFIDFIRSYKMKKLMREIDTSINDCMAALKLISEHKSLFLVGVGVQKYLHGGDVLRAIDSLAAMLGLFGKEGCGVSYLSDSGYGFTLPFDSGVEKVSKPTVDFSSFDTLFIQGANPASQMPNTKKVVEGIKKAGVSIYFGLYENETSQLCDLVIPAKTFLEKEDIRLSYGSEYIGLMPKLSESDIGISEYALTVHLTSAFDYAPLERESTYIEKIIRSNSKMADDYLVSKSYDIVPYSQGFYTDDEKFYFMDEIYDEQIDKSSGYFLITAKPRHSINSQFKLDHKLYLPLESGYVDGKSVKVSSKYGSAEFEVCLSSTLRSDSVLIYSGAKGLNQLTPSLKSNAGESAVFQEVKIVLEK